MTEFALQTKPILAGLVDLDATWFVQVAVFLTLYAILRRAFFKPYVAFLRRRDEATKGLRARAEVLAARAKEAEESVGKRLAEAKAEAILIRRNLAEEGARLRDEILARERARVQAEVERELAALEALKKGNAARVDQAAAELAALIEGQVRAAETAGGSA